VADDAYRYVTLLCALPALRRPFHWERPPISRVRLEQRLAMLTPGDRARIARIEALIRPPRADPPPDAAALLCDAARLLAELDSPPLREWLHWWLSLKVLTAALRARRDGQADPGVLGEAPRVGRALREHWTHPTFALAHQHPWLETLAPLIQAGDAAATEQALLELAWQYLDRRRPEPPYGLAAVVHYLLRWSLVERGCQRDERRAGERFRALLDAIPDLDASLEADS